MPDQFDRKERSEIMAKVHSTNTTPEIRVRNILEEIGYSFSLKNQNLPGKPDIFLPDFNTVIFVNGCFWHGCPVCRHAKIRPKENAEYWNRKLDRTLERDKENITKLEELGYKVLVIWECETKKKSIDLLRNKINIYFNNNFVVCTNNVKIHNNEKDLFKISYDIIDQLLDLLLPNTITFGQPYKTYRDFIYALVCKRVAFLMDTNILLRAEAMMKNSGVGRSEEENGNFKIIASYAAISKIFNAGYAYMPAILEVIDSEEIHGLEPNAVVEIAYNKLFSSRVLVECTDVESLIDFALNKRNDISMDPIILKHSDEIADKLRTECSNFVFESFLYGHNLLEKRIFNRDVSYCYMCKAWKIHLDKSISKEEKIIELIDWIVQEFVFDPVAFVFCVKLFTNQISLGKKRGNDLLTRLDNQARDINIIREFFNTCRTLQDKDIVFVSLDVKLRKLLNWCSAVYFSSDKLKLCVTDHVFDDCHLKENVIDKFLSHLEKLEKRKIPKKFQLQLVEICKKLENDLLTVNIRR